MEIKIVKTTTPGTKPADESKLGFGKVFTDHMFIMDWTREGGWQNARIVPLEKMELHPASTVLHYGMEVFEGLKAYRTAAGDVQLFRPWENVARLNRSALRMGLPTVNEEEFLEAMATYVSVERDWVPHTEGASLYIRPFMFGDDEFLGLHTIGRVHLMIIAAPSGNYYPEGINPVKIMVEDEDVRAVRGGTGYTKCGGNYAAAQRASERAEGKGFTQVLWLDGVERKYVEEVGSMNMMFKIGGTVVTPALNGSILPGITRMSILEMLRDEGIPVEERPVSIDEVMEAIENGTLEEAWGCGTAAVVSPVGWLAYQGKLHTICEGQIGATTQKLYDRLTGIQWGRLEDPYGWIYPVK